MAKDVNLSSQEWLDIVFDGKNKDYGAYELRANSVRRHNKSVIIVLSILAVIFTLLILLASGVLNFAEEDANAGVDAEQMSLYNAEEDQAEEEEEQVKIEEPKEIELPKEEIVNSQAVTEVVIKKDDEVKTTVKEQEQVLETQTQIGARDEDRGQDDQVRQTMKEEVAVKPVEKPVEPKPVEKPETKEQVYTVANVEQKPSFPGGEAAMYSYLSSHINYPAQAQEEGIEGRVIVEFTVSKTGSIENAHVVRGKHPALDKEALRVVKSMPKWTPARQNGQPVKCTFTLPVQFKLAK